MHNDTPRVVAVPHSCHLEKDLGARFRCANYKEGICDVIRCPVDRVEYPSRILKF